MKVFISWSGTRSKAVAETLRDWLPQIIQAVKPWMSAEDIDKGARWGIDLANELKDTTFGIICLTPENLEEPWIYFEAGALSKHLEGAYVCPFLLGLDTSDIKGPLVQFQLTKASKEDTFKLLESLNKTLGENKLPLSNLERAFEKWWTELELKLREIEESPGVTEKKRSDREIIEEVLNLVRGISRSLPKDIALEDLFGDYGGMLDTMKLAKALRTSKARGLFGDLVGSGLLATGHPATIETAPSALAEKRCPECNAALSPTGDGKTYVCPKCDLKPDSPSA